MGERYTLFLFIDNHTCELCPQLPTLTRQQAHTSILVTLIMTTYTSWLRLRPSYNRNCIIRGRLRFK